MREILLTSSVLILAVLLLRRAFRDRISRRAQYVLWALVLVRLLVPVSLPGADFSVLSAAEPVGRTVTERLEQREIYRVPLAPSPMGTAPQVTSPAPQIEGGGSPSGEAAAPSGGEEAFSYPVIRERVVTAADLLTVLWLIGIAAMAVWFLVTNLRFWQKLRRTRAPYAAENCRYPVYLVEAGLPSPCLFGPVRPAIYLTPAVVASPERLRHVLAHETAHARHLDPLWSLLRSVCLAVYWFDPLVWIAAAVSKADGELACDEAAIQALGEGERIPYGKTLLSLIPVRTGPGSPLLSATTMTADKRQLKDRITRIAQGQQTRAAALFLVLALAAGVCAVTFTGAKADGETGGVRSLTGDELAYFNEEFFNQEGTYSIRNQFLNSLYEKSEDIDLFELLYCGTGIDAPMTDEELRQVGSFDTAGELICPVDKMSVEAINQVLLENTGLTLEETGRIGMDYFQYLPEYDAYYHSHGDTNYFSGVNITAGERVGDTIRLYYDDTFHVDGWKCVTLEEQADGSYWFVSNQPSERPAIPTVYPEGEPVLTIPLTDLTPYEPETMEVIRHRNDCAERGTGYIMHTEDGDELSVRTYLSTDGNLYAAVIYDEAAGRDGMRTWDVGCFFTFPEHNTLSYSDSGGYAVSMDSFSDLFGHDGLVIRYSGELDEHTGATFHDYYYFDTEGNPVLLARVYGTESAVLDLDGDGANELLSDGGQLVFQRDGQLYEADLTALLAENWPEMDFWDYSTIDVSRRCLTVRGTVRNEGDDGPYSFTRCLCFDGEDLLVYKNLVNYTDHVADNIDVPDRVLSAAKDAVLSALDYRRGHTGAMGHVDGQWQQTGTQAEWDDWRIAELVLTDTVPAYPELGMRVYGLHYELHTTTPEDVMLAGGMYMDEDGWVGGLNTLPPVLVFHITPDGEYVLLQSSIPNDVGRSSDNPMFAGLMAQAALENGLLAPSEVRPVDLYYMFYNNCGVFLNLIGAFSLEEQNSTLDAMATYAVGVEPSDNLLVNGLQRLEEYDYDLTEEGELAKIRLQNAWTRAQEEAER
ncbi:M56 family metallopeptidase [Dysosmobacter welbionis]|uniref:M56 family metallopeptidase n=3 Tax=Oscillospiraceae TaxID=216572 RepID=UPI003AB2BC05